MKFRAREPLFLRNHLDEAIAEEATILAHMINTAWLTMILIEIRPHRWGRKVLEAPGVEPVFPTKSDAISYSEHRLARFFFAYACSDAAAASLSGERLRYVRS